MNRFDRYTALLRCISTLGIVPRRNDNGQEIGVCELERQWAIVVTILIAVVIIIVVIGSCL